MKRIVLIMSIVIVLLVTGCTPVEKSVVVASKPMTEQLIITEMMKFLIEDQTDLKVELKQGIGGGTSNIHPAMIAGDIDIYPEYTGTGWMFVLKRDPISDADELYKKVKAEYNETYALTWSERYGFNDTYGLAMKADLAEELSIAKYSDLLKHSESLILGAEYDFFEREDGYDGLVSHYKLSFSSTKEMDIGLKYQAIDQGDVDIINVFSTDGRLKEYGLLVLEDDLSYFPSYYAATITRNETLEQYPELVEVLATFDGLIDNEAMTAMNYQVEVENKDPKDVAKAFLVEKGYLEE